MQISVGKFKFAIPKWVVFQITVQIFMQTLVLYSENEDVKLNLSGPINENMPIRSMIFLLVNEQSLSLHIDNRAI